MSFGPPMPGYLYQPPTGYDRFRAASNYVSALHDNYPHIGETSFVPVAPIYDVTDPRRNAFISQNIANYRADSLNAAFVDQVVVNGQRCARVRLGPG